VAHHRLPHGTLWLANGFVQNMYGSAGVEPDDLFTGLWTGRAGLAAWPMGGSCYTKGTNTI
jgi:hypothetical protein